LKGSGESKITFVSPAPLPVRFLKRKHAKKQFMRNECPALKLSVIITVVGGKEATRNCLKSICPQVDFNESEIIVPFDPDSQTVGELAGEFPAVRFHFIEDLGLAADQKISARTHRLYDRRRAVGLALATGKIIAMTEDLAVASADWCAKIIMAHRENPAAAIGGAIENGVDRTLNWALYYADFGRYGRPLPAREVEYLSDVNVSYKRDALLAVRETWHEAYHEPLVHRALQANGEKLVLDETIVVFERRPPIRFSRALRERVEWGRIFAETRGQNLTIRGRLAYAGGTFILPALLLFRVFKNCRRQSRSFGQIAKILMTLGPLLTCWSIGEFTGYLIGAPRIEVPVSGRNLNSPEISPENRAF
jgi:hypothetical protein